MLPLTRDVRALLVFVLLLPSVTTAQVPWEVTLAATLDPLPIPFCAAVRLSIVDPKTGQRRYTTKAYLTFVATDDAGRPRRVPPIVARSREEKRRYANALIRREHRLVAAGRLVQAATVQAAVTKERTEKKPALPSKVSPGRGAPRKRSK